MELGRLREEIVAEERRKADQEQENSELDAELETLTAEYTKLEELLHGYTEPLKTLDAELNQAEKE